jgi:hypothetical protein
MGMSEFYGATDDDIVLSKEELARLGDRILPDFTKGHRMPENFVKFSGN